MDDDYEVACMECGVWGDNTLCDVCTDYDPEPCPEQQEAHLKMDKQFVVVLFKDGKYKVWPDYGDIAWGSPIYKVLDYFSSQKAAREFVKSHKAQQ